MTELPCVRELFFQQEPTPLLLAYCKIMIKGCDIMQSRLHSKLLIRYATAHGFLREMLMGLGKQEIQNTPPSSFIFRGNSAFTRLFFYFLETQSDEYLNKVIRNLVDQMMTNPRFYFDSVDPTQAENENLIFESLDSVTAIMDELGKLITDNLHLIPPQVVGIIKELLKEVQRKDENADSVFTTFKTIFFLRFLFPALNNAEKYVSAQARLELPQIIDQIKSIVKFGLVVVNGKQSSDKLTQYVIEACGGFSKVVNRTFNIVSKYNEFKSKERIGIDYRSQLVVAEEMLSYVKPFLSEIQSELESSGHSDMFHRLFYCTKKSKQSYSLELTPMTSNTQKMHEFLIGRLSALEQENIFYQKKIKELQQTNLILRNLIENPAQSVASSRNASRSSINSVRSTSQSVDVSRLSLFF